MKSEFGASVVDVPGCTKNGSNEGWRWMVGIVNMLAILALFMLAVVKAPSSVRANNARCLRQIANEEHVTLEAFFQNPTEQDALAQAVAVCSR